MMQLLYVTSDAEFNLQMNWTYPKSSPTHLYLPTTEVSPHNWQIYVHQHQLDELKPINKKIQRYKDKDAF